MLPDQIQRAGIGNQRGHAAGGNAHIVDARVLEVDQVRTLIRAQVTSLDFDGRFERCVGVPLIAHLATEHRRGLARVAAIDIYEQVVCEIIAIVRKAFMRDAGLFDRLFCCRTNSAESADVEATVAARSECARAPDDATTRK